MRNRPAHGAERRSLRKTLLVAVAAVIVVPVLALTETAGGQPSAPSASGIVHRATETAKVTTATDGSYAVVDAVGAVATYGGARYAGDLLGAPLAHSVVGAVTDPAGGYWLVAADGGVFTFGDAGFHGSMGGRRLDRPIVGMAATPDGGGYWLVAADGGVFAFGDARFDGSMGGRPLDRPIVGMAATPDGGGYWLVAADGGVFAFGDARFDGSMGGRPLDRPIVGMAASPQGTGYLLVAADGGVFTFGGFGFAGSLPARGEVVTDITSAAPTPDGRGYWMLGQDSNVYAFGDAVDNGGGTTPDEVPNYPPMLAIPSPAAVAVISDGVGPEAAHQGPVRILFAGDSLGFTEGLLSKLESASGYRVEQGATIGCGISHGWGYDWSGGAPGPGLPACGQWAQQYSWLSRYYHPDVTVVQLGFWESQHWLLDGTYQTLDDPTYYDTIQTGLQWVAALLHADGGKVILETTPYCDDGTPSWETVDFNRIVRYVAAAAPSYVTVVDTNAAIDPNGAYAKYIDGIQARTDDGVHLTTAGIDDFIDPVLDPVAESLGQEVYASQA